jgi:hypothetical protein
VSDKLKQALKAAEAKGAMAVRKLEQATKDPKKAARAKVREDVKKVAKEDPF